MRVEELTGRDVLDIEAAIGKSFSDAAEAGDMMIGFALYWVARRRNEPGYTYDDALGETVETVTAAVGDLNDETPKAYADTGEPLPGSVSTGV